MAPKKKNRWIKKLTRWIKKSLERLAEKPLSSRKRKSPRIAPPSLRPARRKKLSPQRKTGKSVKASKSSKAARVSSKSKPGTKAKPSLKAVKSVQKKVKTVEKVSVKKKAVKPASVHKASVKPVEKAARVKVLPGVLVGTVLHYFDKAKACAFKVTGAELKQGDMVLIQGVRTKFKMKIKTIQINRIPVPSGRKGEDIGIGVTKPVEPGDSVYLIK